MLDIIHHLIMSTFDKVFEGVPSSSYGGDYYQHCLTPTHHSLKRCSSAARLRKTVKTDIRQEHQPTPVINRAPTPDLYVEMPDDVVPTQCALPSNCKRVICCCLSLLEYLFISIVCIVLAAIILRCCIANRRIDLIFPKHDCFSSYHPIDTPDFALYYGGAQIIHEDTSPTSGHNQLDTDAQVDDTNYHRPEKAIMQSMHVGECWAMEGSQGQIAIALITPIMVTNITIQNLYRPIALDITTAPREMELWGQEANDELCKDRVCNPVFLAAFTYNILDLPVQTFAVKHTHTPIFAVLLKIKNNWNNRNHTCLYRVSIHGTPSN